MKTSSRLVVFGLFSLLLVALVSLVPGLSECHAAIEYSSMIAASDFDIARADVSTTAAAMLGISFSLMVVGLIMAVIFK